VEINLITEQIIGAAIAVHRELGPGLLESTYQTCMLHELECRGLMVESQKTMPLFFKGLKMSSCYRLDFLVNERVVVELKASHRLTPIDTAQILTYLKLSGCQVGLLINFNVALLKDGLNRYVNGLCENLSATQRLCGENEMPEDA
jgi:GxxExxY protein